MSKGYLTHFSIVTFLHMLLIVWGWQNLQSHLPTKASAKLGPGALTLRMGEVFPYVAKNVQQKETRKTYKVSPEARPLQEEVQTATSRSGHAQGVGSSAQNNIEAVSLYKAELRAQIDKNKYYPPLSRRLGQTGIVVVAFTLLEDGNIINVRIEKPSQYDRLNVSALEAVKKVERFRPIPKEVGQTKMDITVPLKFITI